MAKDRKAKGGDYEVGYGKPPKQHQFPKGKSGNPRGAPAKRKRTPIDVAGVLNEPLMVKNSGVRQKMAPFEVGVRRLVERGLKHKDLNAILEFLFLCECYRLVVPPAVEEGGGVITAPKGVNLHEWVESVTEMVPASSLGEEDDDIGGVFLRIKGGKNRWMRSTKTRARWTRPRKRITLNAQRIRWAMAVRR